MGRKTGRNEDLDAPLEAACVEPFVGGLASWASMMSSLTHDLSSKSEFLWQLLERPLQSEPLILRPAASIGRMGPSSDSCQPLLTPRSFETFENIEHDDVTGGDDKGGGWSPNLLQTLLRTGSLISGALLVFFIGVMSPSLPQPLDRITSILKKAIYMVSPFQIWKYFYQGSDIR